MTGLDTAKNRVIGSVCVFFGFLLSQINELIIKSSGLTVAQVSVGRFGTQLILAMIWWNIQKPTNPFVIHPNSEDDGTPLPEINNWYGDYPNITNVWLRGILFATHMVSFYLALILLPIGDLQCIFYQAPLIITYIGYIWLKEQLPSKYVLIPTTFLTVIGLIIVSQPTFLICLIDSSNDYESLNIYGVILAFAAALFYAFSVLLIRKATTSHFLQLEFASSACILIIVVPILLIINSYILHVEWVGNFDFTDSNEWDFDIHSTLIMLLIGCIGFMVLSLIVTGYQIAEVTHVSWLEYISIPLGFISQAVVFQDIPNKYEIVGCVLVLTGCLLPSMKQIYVYFSKRRVPQDEDNLATFSEQETLNNDLSEQ